MEKARQEAKEFFESLSREEFKDLLTEVGFNVKDGSGQIIFTDEVELSFTIKGIISKHNDQICESNAIPYFPIAC